MNPCASELRISGTEQLSLPIIFPFWCLGKILTQVEVPSHVINHQTLSTPLCLNQIQTSKTEKDIKPELPFLAPESITMLFFH